MTDKAKKKGKWVQPKAPRPRFIWVDEPDGAGGTVKVKIYTRKGETARQCQLRHIRQLKKESIKASIARGASKVEAAGAAGVSRDTLYEWMNADAEFAQAVVTIEKNCITNVEGALYVNALKPEGKIDRIFYLKNRAGYRDKTDFQPHPESLKQPDADGAESGAPSPQPGTTGPADPANVDHAKLDEMSDAQLEEIAYGADTADEQPDLDAPEIRPPE